MKLVRIIIISFILLCIHLNEAFADYVRGIYVTQPMLESKKRITYLIQNAKELGINTFVIDLNRISKLYDKNINLVKDAGITYVARIIVFPNGGTKQQVKSEAFWLKPYKYAEHAMELGAAEIQLDYIRYNTKQPQIKSNAQDIYQVIKWFREKTNEHNVKLQIAVFGETSFKPSLAIGQDIELFSDSIDSLNPMVYPSHYYPYYLYSSRPYQTVYDSVSSIREHFDPNMPFRLCPYVEVNNFRYRYPYQKRLEYVYKQIKAVEDAGGDGWYAWSANNKYEILFKVLRTYNLK